MREQSRLKRVKAPDAMNFSANNDNDYDNDDFDIFSEPDKVDRISFLVVEERPLLNHMQSAVLSTTAAATWIVGVWVNSRIGRLLLKRRSSSGRSAIDKLLLAYTVISIITYSPLLVSVSLNHLKNWTLKYLRSIHQKNCRARNLSAICQPR